MGVELCSNLLLDRGGDEQFNDNTVTKLGASDGRKLGCRPLIGLLWVARISRPRFLCGSGYNTGPQRLLVKKEISRMSPVQRVSLSSFRVTSTSTLALTAVLIA